MDFSSFCFLKEMLGPLTTTVDDVRDCRDVGTERERKRQTETKRIYAWGSYKFICAVCIIKPKRRKIK